MRSLRYETVLKLIASSSKCRVSKMWVAKSVDFLTICPNVRERCGQPYSKRFMYCVAFAGGSIINIQFILLPGPLVYLGVCTLMCLSVSIRSLAQLLMNEE